MSEPDRTAAPGQNETGQIETGQIGPLAMQRPATPSASVPSWVSAMGLATSVEDGCTVGAVDVTPAMLGPSTGRLRVGVLSTIVDVVGGTPATGPLNPTIDLRVQMIDPSAVPERLRFVCRPLRAGRTIYVAEVPVHGDRSPDPIAVGTVTFMNRAVPNVARFDGARPALAVATLDELLGARREADGTAVLDMNPVVANGFTGTVQGGAQAMFAELSTEWALAEAGHPVGSQVIDDLDIRYLNRLASGSMRAVPELWPVGDGGFAVRVALTDAADSDRVVSFVRLRTRPVR